MDQKSDKIYRQPSIIIACTRSITTTLYKKYISCKLATLSSKIDDKKCRENDSALQLTHHVIRGRLLHLLLCIMARPHDLRTSMLNESKDL